MRHPENEQQAWLEVTHARHVLWLYGEPGGEQADFTRQCPQKLDFSGKDFGQALFCHAQIARCDFTGCALDGADFTGAKLYCCDFTDAELESAEFSEADIQATAGLGNVAQGPAMTMAGG